MSTLKRLTAAVLIAGALALISPAVTGSAQAVVTSAAQPVSETMLPAATADEGLAVVGDGRHLLTRGHRSIPPRLRRLGWGHIGDPGSAPGLVVDAYQGSRRATAKAFVVTYANGRRSLLVHPLVRGESFHNSFAAVTPDGRWLVSGEWGTVHRLLVFALPPPTRRRALQRLALAGVIALSRPVRNVQGCDFGASRQLLCSTNDMTTTLFPVVRQLLSLRLSHSPGAGAVSASVHLVANVPAQDVCAGPSGEVEGIDITDGTVRVAVNSPCSPVTEVFTYARRAQWGSAGDIDVRTSWSGPPPLVDVPVHLPAVRRIRADD